MISVTVTLTDPKTKRSSDLLLTEDGLRFDDAPLDPEGLRYKVRMLQDGLEIGGVLFDIPRGKAESVRACIAAARLPKKGSPLIDERAKTVDEPTRVERIFLESLLDTGEIVLVYLETASKVEVPSALMREKVSQFFLVTDQRQALVSVTGLGDSEMTPLSDAAIVVEKSLTGDTIVIGRERFDAPRLSESLFTSLAELLLKSPSARVMEMARLHTPARPDDNAKSKVARSLLDEAFSLRDPLATLSLWALKKRLTLAHDISDEECLQALRLLQESTQSAALVSWMRGFKIPTETGLVLLDMALKEGDDGLVAWVQDLHSYLRQERLGDDELDNARIDLEYAAHLMQNEAFEDVERILQARLQTLPSEELADLIPNPGEDLTSTGAQTLRIQLLDVLALARGRGTPDAGTLKELACLCPLVEFRVRAFYEVAEGEQKERAGRVLTVLNKGGLAPFDEDNSDVDAPLSRLSKEQLFLNLQHPVARKGHALEKLQSFLAKARVPNKSALQNYCERLSKSTAPYAPKALADASMALGLKGVTAFISRGERGVGVRAYEGEPSFLLLGGEHIDKESAFYLHPWELRFLVGAELAHLRFQHSRVTADDVWKGAVDKGKFGVELVLSAVPLLKGVEVIDRVGKIIDRYQGSVIGRVTKGVDLADKTATKLRGKKIAPKVRSIDVGNRELIAAHRVMQLTADRAGLLFSVDLGAAVRAIFLMDPVYHPELEVAAHHGLAKSLSRRGDDGAILFQDLTIRLAAMIGFYLSDEFALLQKAMRGEQDETN